MKNKTYKTILLALALVSSLLNSGYTKTSANINGLAGVSSPAPQNVNISSCQIFPDNNYWNIPVDTLPVDSHSSTWVNSIGANQGFHMDFGSGLWDGGPIGIPYNVFPGSSVNSYNINFYYPDESDPGPYPLPAHPKIEWGSDHHILSVDTDTCKLYEIYDASQSNAGIWSAGSGAIWNLNSNVMRPDTWTSADAAGLPILPGLARYDEVATGIIEHALRFTAECTADSYIWPARHKAPHGSCAHPVPFGARFRLKSNFDISGYSPQAQVLLQAYKKYGIVLADNGSNWYVSGEPNPGWDNDVLHELDALTGSDFEAVDTSSLMVDPNSAATNYSATPHVYSIKRLDSTPTSSSTFRFNVYFSEPVTGVDTTDFSLETSGDITNAQITSVTGSNLAYTVTAGVDSGFGSVKLNLVDDNSIQDTSSNSLGGIAIHDGDFNNGELYTRVNTIILPIAGTGVNDGWILESTETSGSGEIINSSASTLNIGDDSANKQYRAILSFDTSPLPDTAQIISVTLNFKYASKTGTLPFNTHGNLLVDIRKGAFSNNTALQPGDFKSSASKNNILSYTNTTINNWYEKSISAANFAYINLSNVTQFRLRFTKDDNNDYGADLLKIFSGNAAAANRPQLIIEYYTP